MDVRSLLKVMVEREASDLYLTVDRSPTYRIYGVTQSLAEPPFTNEQLEAVAQGLMRERQRTEFEEKMEMNLALYYPELGRFRVNLFRQRGNVGIVFRLIKVEIVPIDELGLPPIVKDISMSKRGLVLVVGATGCGKSTTLAALIDLQLSLNLRAIISQRLNPSLDGKRLPALGILMDTPRIRDLIKKGEVDVLQEAMEQGLQEGCQTFDHVLFLLYKEGKISLEHALINADSANNLRLKIKLAGLKGDKAISKILEKDDKE